MNQQKIVKLRTIGFSLREISKKMNVSYGPVQRTCSNVKMSKNGLKRYSKLNGLTRDIKFRDGLNEIKVRIIGNLVFDGAVYTNCSHYSIMYVNNSKGLIEQFIRDMQDTYNVKPSSHEITGNYQRIKYYSKLIYKDLLKYSKSYSTSDKKCTIPQEIMKGKRMFKIQVLRSFWENEGSISAKGMLSADLKSLKVIMQLSQLHNELGLNHKICQYWDISPTYKLYLPKTQETYRKFLELGLFSKANVVRGYNTGRKKIEVLKEHYKKKLA